MSQMGVMRYPGGKKKLAPWIVSHFPAHRCYVEPFGGGASVLMQKPRSYVEVYNDIDGEIVNVFRVLRDHPGELTTALQLTPYAKDEFVQSYDPCPEKPIEWARRTLFRSRAGFGSWAVSGRPTGFRADSRRAGTTPVGDWARYPDYVPDFADRLRGVVIDNRTAAEVMADHDAPDTLFYVDPPYVKETRSSGKYRHDMTDEQQLELATQLHSLEGTVILSGYAGTLYDELYGEWKRVDRETWADGANARTESLWISRTTPLPLFAAPEGRNESDAPPKEK